MKILFSSLFLLLASSLLGQYYYNDIISLQQGMEQYKLFRSQRIHKVTANSFEADNSPSEGFKLEQDISLDGKKIVLQSQISNGRASITSRNYELSKLKKTVAASNGIETKTEYGYLENGQLQKILVTTSDTAMHTQSTELHSWNYDTQGQPDFMLKIKNGTDTIRVEFLKDEQGLIAEERWKKKNRTLETYYYYYDNKKQLTDIVRFNSKLKKLIPDLQFAYDEKGRIISMTEISLSTSNYLIWQYDYNEKGLKTKETAYAKEKQLVGSIVYSYEQ